MSNVRYITTQSLPPAPVSSQEAEELKVKLQEALAEMRQAKDYDQYMDMSERAQMEMLEAQLKATLTLIDHFLKTGEWGVPGLGGPAQGTYNATGNLIRDLNPGWNGDVNPSLQVPPGYNLASVSSQLSDDAEFAGFLYTQEDSDPTTPIEIAWQASQNTIKIEAFNYGRDIIYVETYRDDEGNEQQRFWVGKDHVVRVDVNVVIDAHNLQDHGLIADFHRVLRISDGSHNIRAGAIGGITAILSEHNDDFVGTQGEDNLIGMGGSDTLSGEGGSDVVYGDYGNGYFFDQNGQLIPEETVRQSLGVGNNPGDDTIDGGAGRDFLYGEAGINYGVETDADSGPGQETKVNLNNLPRTGSMPSDNSWFLDDAGQTEGWEISREINNYTVEIAPTDETLTENSQLVLQMPAGYDYVYAENNDGSPDIRLTFVKHVENGAPQTFVVIIKGALRDRTGNLLAPFTLKIKGNGEANIIDFHKVNFGNNNFVVEGISGDDMVINPQNDLNTHGWSLNDMLNTYTMSGSTVQTGDYENTVVPRRGDPAEGERQPGFSADREGNEIVITASRDARGEEPINVQIDPSEFDRGYVLVDPEDSGDLLVLLVKESPAGGDPEVLVIRIENYDRFLSAGADPGDLSWLQVDLNADAGGTGAGEDGEPEQTGLSMFLTPLIAEERDGQFVSGNIINAGAGSNDFVYQWAGDSVEGAESSVTGFFSETAETGSTSSTTTTTPETPDPETPEDEGDAG